MGIPVVRRAVRKKKIIPGEMAAIKPLTLDQEPKRSMLVYLDVFRQEINTRCENMECIADQSAILMPSNPFETS